jgi:hypothetical protein
VHSNDEAIVSIPAFFASTRFQVDGLPDGAKPTLSIQLSSPIEEGKLSLLHDPLNQDPSPEGALVVFQGVETTVATLSVSAMDADIPLGTSSPVEVAQLCALDPMNIKAMYVTELPVAIVGDGGGETQAVGSVEDVATTEEGQEASATGDVVADDVIPIEPVCVLTLRITYKPSPKDQREELYELLNRTSQRKANALENLRAISMQVAGTTTASGGASARGDSSGSTGMPSKPSVKPGFLNAKSKAKEESRLKKFYDHTLGPDSLVRRGAFLVFVLKDYLIFFGAVTFFHLHGTMLALPPPA